MVAVHKIKGVMSIDNTVYVCMCILHLSKTLWYDFHYNYIKKKFDHKTKLLFKDTDSLVYEIETYYVCEDFHKDRDKFYFSKFPENWPFYEKASKK